MHGFHQAFDTKLRDVEVAESCIYFLCMAPPTPTVMVILGLISHCFCWKTFITNRLWLFRGIDYGSMWNSMNCVVFKGDGFIGLSLLMVDFKLEGGSNMYTSDGYLSHVSKLYYKHGEPVQNKDDIRDMVLTRECDM